MPLTKKLLLPALTVAMLAVPFGFAQNAAPQAPAQAPVSPQAPASSQTTTPAQSPAIGGTMHAPIRAGGVVALDLPDSSAQSVSLDIVKGRFADYSVGRIKLTGEGIDFRNGTLQGLRADIAQGEFENVPVDQMNLAAPAFSFDTMQLLNNRTFVLSQPVTANVKLTLSEAGLNKFLASPKTLEKVEKAIQKKTGGLKLISFSNASLTLLGGSKVKMNVTGVIAQGISVPLEMTGKLGVKNGQVGVSNLVVTSGGSDVQLPVDVASAFESKINEMIDFKKLGKNNFVITADSLKQSGKQLQIDGHATLTRLKFG